MNGRIPVSLFVSCARVDLPLAGELRQHLAFLRRLGAIRTWDIGTIVVGDDQEAAIAALIDAADIILLLLSSSYVDSDECYKLEAERALSRHESGAAWVIPVLLRPCLYLETPFGKLASLPRNGTPVTSHADRDTAWLDVVGAMKTVIERLRDESPKAEVDPQTSGPGARGADTVPHEVRAGDTVLLGRPPITILERQRIGLLAPTNLVAFQMFRGGVRLAIEAEHEARPEDARTKRRAACHEILDTIEYALRFRFDRLRDATRGGVDWTSIFGAKDDTATERRFLEAIHSTDNPSLDAIGDWVSGPTRLQPTAGVEMLCRMLGIPVGLESHVRSAGRFRREISASKDVASDKVTWLEWTAKCLLDRRLLERIEGTAHSEKS